MTVVPADANEDGSSRNLEKNSMNSTASDLRSHLGTIDQRMAALESQMALLRKEREEVLEDLAAIVYPILTIPNDITSEVFIHWYADRPPHQYSPLLLASICRLWRAVALSTCRLWTRLNFGQADSSALTTRLLYWLPRAGSLPVDLRIALQPPPSQESEAIFRIIAQYSSRWGNLHITSNRPISIPVNIHCSFPSLTKLTLATHPSSEGPTEIPPFLDAPNLREVSLSNVALVDWHTSLPWIQLTTLDNWFHTVHECLEILSHTPNLEVLIFSYGFSTEPVTSPPCVLHRLHTLRIGSEDSPELLDHLILPSLDHVHFSSEYPDRVARLISRSGCSPRTLELDVYDPDFAAIRVCIFSMPSLRDLRMTLHGVGGTSEDFRSLFETLADPSVLSALESFSIWHCQINIELLPLVQMLAARSTGMDGVAKLKSFRLIFDQESPDKDVVDLKQLNMDVELALDQLRGLRSEGLNVEIGSLIKWFGQDVNSHMIEEIGHS
ncbi:hypothetical protein C8R44DRAFT_363481 [Mycena epipterygia]|nr:hypothetical protein C8R44DRAFT_363481 [Mycena epipterygia]